MSETRHRLHRRAKDLARSFDGPMEEDCRRLSHLLRYIHEPSHYKTALRPFTTLPADFGQALLRLFFCPVHFVVSTAQSVIALSTAESELCAIGTGTERQLHLRSFLLETKLLGKLNNIIEAESSSGKAIAIAFGATQKAR